jgi:hypothetical protein
MEEQIKSAMYEAFWDKLEEDVKNNQLEHISTLLTEIKDALKSFVPSRNDIHQSIEETIGSEITWDTQNKLVFWIEKFQAPNHDHITNNLKQKIPMNISTFLKQYYAHLSAVHKEVFGYRQRLANGENIFKALNVETSGNNVPTNMKSGLF